MPSDTLRFELPPYRLSGVVVGALMNHPAQVQALGDAVGQPPYKAAPQAPVLQIKPRNTLAADGEAIEVPAGVDALEVGASLGIVIGRTACRVPADAALNVAAGYLIVADISVPQAGSGRHYRPSVRFKARDGFCPLGPQVVAAATIAAPDALAVRIVIDGVLAQAGSTAGRVRGVAQLIADVSEFMTLQPGDVLMLGPPPDAPQVRAGQTMQISIDGLGTLSNRFVPTTAREQT